MKITDKIIPERRIKFAKSLGIVIRINALTLRLQWMHEVLPHLQVYVVLLFDGARAVHCPHFKITLREEINSLPLQTKQNCQTRSFFSVATEVHWCLSKLWGRCGPKWVQNWQLSTGIQVFLDRHLPRMAQLAYPSDICHLPGMCFLPSKRNKLTSYEYLGTFTCPSYGCQYFWVTFSPYPDAHLTLP